MWIAEVANVPDVSSEVFMKIDCYLSPGCGSEETLRENITKALAIEKVETEVIFHRIDDEKAIALGLSGSPSVFINDKELQPQGTVGFS
jgi:hypothetical protein